MKKWTQKKWDSESQRVHCDIYPTKACYRTAQGAKAIAEKQSRRTGKQFYLYTCGSHWHTTSMSREQYRKIDKKTKV